MSTRFIGSSGILGNNTQGSSFQVTDIHTLLYQLNGEWWVDWSQDGEVRSRQSFYTQGAAAAFIRDLSPYGEINYRPSVGQYPNFLLALLAGFSPDAVVEFEYGPPTRMPEPTPIFEILPGNAWNRLADQYPIQVHLSYEFHGNHFYR